MCILLKIKLCSNYSNTRSSLPLAQATTLYNPVHKLFSLHVPFFRYVMVCLAFVSLGASPSRTGLLQILWLREVYAGKGPVLWLVCERGQVSPACVLRAQVVEMLKMWPMPCVTALRSDSVSLYSASWSWWGFNFITQTLVSIFHAHK